MFCLDRRAFFLSVANARYIAISRGQKRKVRIVEVTRQRTQMKMQTKVNNGLERKKNNQMREIKKRTYIYIWNKVYNVHVYTF